ncbi:MAG: hypothetical protein QXT27_06320 [Pyrobaculum sp.]
MDIWVVDFLLLTRPGLYQRRGVWPPALRTSPLCRAAACGERTMWRVFVVDPVVINYRADKASFDGVVGFFGRAV